MSRSRSITTIIPDIEDKIMQIAPVNIIVLEIVGLLFLIIADANTTTMDMPNILVTNIIVNRTHPLLVLKAC